MSKTPGSTFDPRCTRCPRLAAFLAEVRGKHPDYHARPVPPFGPIDAGLLIVGLAPGMHGANATGRPFTGDFAGILLYETLHRHGLASHPASRHVDDGLRLHNCRITNAVKCLPPQNKPKGDEIRACNAFLAAELAASRDLRVILALGRIAHEAVLRARGLKISALRFAHGAEHALEGGVVLVDSYHCSRYNTQTRRLTPEMFDRVVARAATLATGGANSGA
ncbi:MAG: uracil-DNA glycosylase [Gammaproteobacteria bacterium]